MNLGAQAPAVPFTVIIDPGHGGSDQGIVGANLVKEKNLTLHLAELVKKILAGRPEIAISLTRLEDATVSDSARVALANRLKANLFISIHAGSLLQTPSNGFAVFYSGSDDRIKSAKSSSSFLAVWSGMTNAYEPDCLRAAKSAQNNLSIIFQKIQPPECPCPYLGTYKAPLNILEGCSFPAIAIEIGNLANARQCALFKEEAYDQELARAIGLIIEEFYIKR